MKDKRKKNAAAGRPLVAIRLRRVSDGEWLALMVVPAGAASITTTGKAKTKAGALAQAGTLAERVLKDPVISAIMPPQAVAAVKVARRLGKAAKMGRGVLKRLWGRTKGPGKARLVKALAAEATA